MQVSSSNGAKHEAPRTNAGTPFNLSPQLTPTLTYTEFALICGSTLLSGDDCQPALRLHRCLEQIITTTHVTWAVSVVHVLGRHLHTQYTIELGFFSAKPTSASNSSKRAAADKSPAKGSVVDKKPFKVSWVSKWIDLDSSTEEFGNGVASATSMSQKEQVFVPGGMCQALRVFLHKINQHGSAALVSIDTMQSAPATISVSAAGAKRNFQPVGSAHGASHKSSNAVSSVVKSASRDEFADLLGEIEEVSDDGGDEFESSAFFEANGFLATLASVDQSSKTSAATATLTNSKAPTTSVVLAHVANRLLTQLSLSFIHQISMTLLNEVRPSGGNATAALIVSNEALEEASLQCVFDLSICELLTQQWGMVEWHSTATAAAPSKSANKRGGADKRAVVGLSTAIERWKSHLDPINAELVLPLVMASTTSHMASMALLAPHCNSNAVSKKASDVTSRMSSATSTSAKTSEQLLASVFPSASHTAARFVLLPLAVSTAPPVVQSAARNTSSSTSASGSSAQSAARSTTTAASANSSAAGAATTSSIKESTSAKSKGGVMNWWG